MPDTRLHRGKHPDDDRLFGAESYQALRQAAEDLSLLLSKGYADKSSLKLVGDHFSLTERQRTAVARCSCSDSLLTCRQKSLRPIESVRNQTLALDGYNVLITTESAMSGAYLFKGRDGCFRDLAGIHGTYRKVTETIPALEIIGKVLTRLGIKRAVWYLDSPVSNSGRLKTIIRKTYENAAFECEVQLVDNPDKILKKSEQIIATSDSAILDECSSWINLMEVILDDLQKCGYRIELIDLSKKRPGVLGLPAHPA